MNVGAPGLRSTQNLLIISATLVFTDSIHESVKSLRKTHNTTNTRTPQYTHISIIGTFVKLRMKSFTYGYVFIIKHSRDEIPQKIKQVRIFMVRIRIIIQHKTGSVVRLQKYIRLAFVQRYLLVLFQPGWKGFRKQKKKEEKKQEPTKQTMLCTK